MTTDDLKTALDDLGRSLDTGYAPEAPPSRDAMRRSRSALAFLHTVLRWEAVQAIVFIALLAWFLTTNTSSSWAALGSAALLLALEGAYLVATIRQHVLLTRIDYASPVVHVQRQLAVLMVLRSRTVWAVLIAAPLLWLPLLIVAAEWIAGVDVIATANGAWVAANLGLGLIILGIGLWIARRPPRWVRRSPRLRRALNHLAGRNLRRALEHAEEASAFERESRP